MSPDVFDRELESWLTGQAPTVVPDGLHDAVVGAARRRRQRPSWLPLGSGSAFGAGSRAVGRVRPRLAYVVAIAALALALAAAVAAGALLQKPENPLLGRNGMIVFTGSMEQATMFSSDIHAAGPDGTDERVIAEGWCPAFTTDGRHLTYLGYGTHSPALYVAEPDGSSPREVAGYPVVSFGPSTPIAMSPDGAKIAWFGAQIRYEAQLTPTLIDGSMPANNREIWLTSIDGREQRPLFPAPADSDQVYGPPVWSPDGRWIAAAVMRASADEETWIRDAIDVVEVPTGKVRRVTTIAGDSTEISWSPDSHTLAYPGRSRVGSPGIFAVGVDGTGERILAGSSEHVSVPQWSPDGSRILYIVEDFFGRRVAVSTVQPDAAEEPLAGPYADGAIWSPDGSTILLTRRGNGAPELEGFTGDVIAFVDAGFEDPPRLIPMSRGPDCLPSWQRLAP
jgi:WD40 repeat protein